MVEKDVMVLLVVMVLLLLLPARGPAAMRGSVRKKRPILVWLPSACSAGGRGGGGADRISTSSSCSDS
jgi:hypothetical protein